MECRKQCHPQLDAVFHAQPLCKSSADCFWSAGATAKAGASEHPPAPQADPANPSTPASQTIQQGLRPEGASAAAPSASADPFQATASFLNHQRGGNVPDFGSAEARAERDRFAALLQAAARSNAQASQAAASQDTATPPQPATAPFRTVPGVILPNGWDSAEARAERDRRAAILQADFRANAQANQPAASATAAVTPQQQPERAQEETPAEAMGPLGQSAALEEAAGGSSDAQAMSEGEPGGSPVTPQTAEGAASEPEAMSEGESRAPGAPETEPIQTPEPELAQQPSTQDQELPGQPPASSCMADAAGPSAAAQAPVPMDASSQQQPQQEQRPQRSRAAPDQAPARAATAADTPPPPPDDSSVRRGAVNQPHRASRHAHPKPLEAAVLTISDAVLCSEMGVHFSSCGRLLAACVACQVSSSHHCFLWPFAAAYDHWLVVRWKTCCSGFCGCIFKAALPISRLTVSLLQMLYDVKLFGEDFEG